MPIYNIPPLREGVALGRAVRPGDWAPISGTLADLSGAIAVADNIAVDPVRSIPDPWAQLRVFGDALLYPQPMLGDVTAQWRGLLALLALGREYADVYTLGFETLDLAASGSPLAVVLRELAPRRQLPLNAANDAATWLRPVVVSLKLAGETGARPIAVLNPLTLIAPGRDVEKLAVGAIPWLRSGLTDPARLSGEAALPLEQMAALRHYLLQLRADLKAQCGDDNEELTRLCAHIERFAADCSDPMLQPGVAEAAFEIVSDPPTGTGMAPLYRQLRRSTVIGDPPLGASACMVPLREDLAVKPFAGLVLLDAGLQDTLGRSANRIALWGKTTLRMALDSAAVRARVAKEAADAGYLLVTPEDFFTDAFVRLNDDKRDGHIAAHPAAFANALLPLSPLVLLVASPGDLKQVIGVEEEGSVSLALRLRDGDRGHLVRRNYAAEPRPGDGLLLDRMAWGYGDVALWPDFKSPEWRHYCARLTFPTLTDRRIRGRLVTSGDAIAAMLMHGTLTADGFGDPVVNAMRAQRVEPWRDARAFGDGPDPLPPLKDRVFAAPWLKRLRGKDYDNVVVELQTSPTAFEAVLFTIRPRDGKPLPAGMALVNLRPPLAAPTRGGVVAVDFGTTNTVACIDTEAPVRFQTRIVHPIGSRTPDFLKRATTDMAKNFQDFMPPDDHVMPTPSVVIARDLDAEGRAALARSDVANQLMFEHLVYFQPVAAPGEQLGALNINDWRGLLTRTIFNLKWSIDPETITASKRYLRQVILMLAAEAADQGIDPKRLKWRFSRPESMSNDGDFRTSIWNQIKEIIPDAPPDALESRLRSEGLSAARHILSGKGDRSFTRRDINVILDIGGGTTDIAIWSKGDPRAASIHPRLLWSGSLRLAGGAFFTGHIINNPRILTSFGLPQWTEVLTPAGDGATLTPELRRYVGELLFSGKSLNAAMEASWHEISQSDEVQRLLQTALVYLGGVAWHVGSEIRRLVGEGVIDAGLLDGQIAVALCGRGAGLFKRIHASDDANARTPVSRLLGLVARAAGVEQPKLASVFFSRELKIEVAAGMLDSGIDLSGFATANDDLAAFDDSEPARPVYSFGDKPLLQEMDGFLREFGRFADFSIDLDDRSRLETSMVDFLDQDRKLGLLPQEPFVYALRELVSMVSQPPDGGVRPKINVRGR
ncbi:hypothetical protein IP88_09105 [alpha proteobacterium AAP81b]|nr:hypothetical protein IP88_09105 [alpha proteobacterium AAP81b]